MSPDSFPIHDLYVRPLSLDRQGGDVRMVLLCYEDHILSRFGMLEFVRLEPRSSTPFMVREIADEVWTLVQGRVEFVWKDLRLGSPTRDNIHCLSTREPTLVLVPFGVAFGVRSSDDTSTLIRLTTHADGEHANDQLLSWDRLT